MRLWCTTSPCVDADAGAYGVTHGLDSRSLPAEQRCRTAGRCGLCPTPRGLP